ncbi:hypothetical protein HY522_09915, partial [bacterium]|nr:hypothetical protein [bacterium]
MSKPADLHNLILRMSLRTKITLAMMIVSIGVTTGVAQFALWRIERIILDNVESTGKFMVSSLSDHIAGLLAQSQYFEIREILEGILHKDDRILFIVVKDLTTPEKVDVAQVGDPEWVRASEGIFGDRIVSARGSDLYVFFKPVEIRGVEELLGVVRIGLSLDYMRGRLTETRDFVLAIMALAICFSLVLALVISNAVLTPMRSLMAG